MHAILGGHLNAVKFLLEAGANVSIPEKNGYTLAHGAAFHGRYKIVPLLNRYGVELNTVHEDGFYPIHRACWGHEERYTRTVAAFINVGISPFIRAKTENAETPLMLAKSYHTQRLLNQAMMAWEGENVLLQFDLSGGELDDEAKIGL